MSEILIAGGGLAGAASAIQLAAAGRSVTIVEKEVGSHDKVCGEFLSHEAIHYLTRLGIDPVALGAVSIDTIRFAGASGVQERKLPFAAQSLSRRVLDEALLAKAEQSGARILRGVTMQGIEAAGENWKIACSNENLTAPVVFLASGKHDVRGLKRPAGRQNDLVGFKMHWRLSPAQKQALGSAVELFLFPGGYGGLEPIEDGKANLCFLIRRSMLERVGGQWDNLLATICAASPLLAQRLEGAVAHWEKPLAISAIPYGYIRRNSDGLWRLGDQAAVIPSFSGDGMSIALHSAWLASSLYLTGQSAAQYQSHLASDVARQVHVATIISRALVSLTGQRLCSIAAGWLPQLIGIAAGATRIPDSAMCA